jgi:membrane fusion protein (multidrug efflux system)
MLLLLVAAAVAIPGWSYLSSYADTDDAQIDGHISAVSSRINGTIAHVYVIDTQSVRKGQLLADIAPADYVVAVESARARLAQTEAQVESARRTIRPHSTKSVRTKRPEQRPSMTCRG